MVTTLLGRAVGDLGVRRFGAVAVVRAGAVVAAGGFAVVAAAPGAWVGMLGFTLLGLGLCVIVPQTFAAAGRHASSARGLGRGRRAAEHFQLRGLPDRFAAGGRAGGRVELSGRDARADGAGAGDAGVRPLVRALDRPDTVTGMSGRAQLMWDEAVTGYDFGSGHPMDPVRLALTMRLVEAFGLDRGPWRWSPPSRPGTRRCGWCTARTTSRRSQAASADPAAADGSYGLGTVDDPAFAGMHEASALIAGQSVGAAEAVWRGEALHAVNFAGGLHHAMPGGAAGFCIYNDASLAIARLLELGAERVAYVDVDVHHGDGVQAAFWDDPRVLTISLHEHPRTLFPQTGWPEETGGRGRGGHRGECGAAGRDRGRGLAAGLPRGGAGAAGGLPAAGAGDAARGRHALRGSAGASGGDRWTRSGRCRRPVTSWRTSTPTGAGSRSAGAAMRWWTWCRGRWTHLVAIAAGRPVDAGGGGAGGVAARGVRADAAVGAAADDGRAVRRAWRDFGRRGTTRRTGWTRRCWRPGGRCSRAGAAAVGRSGLPTRLRPRRRPATAADAAPRRRRAP